MSLREIARRAGVSVATVSRVINDVDRQKVGEETRARILDIARTMRYRPNPQAVSLVTRRPPNTLGLFIPYNSHVFESFYFTETIRGAVDAASGHGMNISLFVPSRDAPSDVYHEMLTDNRSVAGMLLIGTRVDDPAIAECRAAGAPFVVINNSVADPDVSYVDCDNVSGAADATRHLIRLGHTRIAFITGPPVSSNAKDRRTGYERALAGAGLALDESLVADGRVEEQGGREAMRALLAQGPRPTAVFAANDMMALGAMKTIRREGFRVPEDIAVIGFDDIPISQYIEPSLTTVHQPMYQIGRRAAETLAAQVLNGRDETAATRHILRTRLVIRESCGARRPPEGSA